MLQQATIISLLLALACQQTCSYPIVKINNGANIEALIREAVQRKDNLVLEAVSLATDKVHALMQDLSYVFGTDLGHLSDTVVDNKASEILHVFTNDVWTIVDTTNANIDVVLDESVQQIESRVPPNNRKLADEVDAILKELRRTNWKWEQDSSEVIITDMTEGNTQLDKITKEILHALHSRGNVGAVLTAGKQSLLELINRAEHKVLNAKASIENSLRALRAKLVAITTRKTK